MEKRLMKIADRGKKTANTTEEKLKQPRPAIPAETGTTQHWEMKTSVEIKSTMGTGLGAIGLNGWRGKTGHIALFQFVERQVKQEFFFFINKAFISQIVREPSTLTWCTATLVSTTHRCTMCSPMMKLSGWQRRDRALF